MQALGLVAKAHHDHEVAFGDRRWVVCRIVLVESDDEADVAFKRHARAACGGVVQIRGGDGKDGLYARGRGRISTVGPDLDDRVGLAVGHVGRGGQDEFETQDVYRIVSWVGALELAEGFAQGKPRLGGQGDAGYLGGGLR